MKQKLITFLKPKTLADKIGWGILIWFFLPLYLEVLELMAINKWVLHIPTVLSFPYMMVFELLVPDDSGLGAILYIFIGTIAMFAILNITVILLNIFRYKIYSFFILKWTFLLLIILIIIGNVVVLIRDSF